MPFGEFAESVNKRVEPSTAAPEIYVGPDDLDFGSPHIRRWARAAQEMNRKTVSACDIAECLLIFRIIPNIDKFMEAD